MWLSPEVYRVCRCATHQTASLSREQQTGIVGKTDQEQRKPTPAPERALEAVVWRGRERSNPAREQRSTRYRHRGACIARSHQEAEAELQALRADLPEYAAMHSPVVPEVLARRDTTYQAFFQRVAHGEKPGFRRFPGRKRYTSCTVKDEDNGARLANG